LAKKEEAKKVEEIVEETAPLSDEQIIDGFFDEVPEKEPVFVAIGGPAGLGKTHFLNTFPTPVIADTEARAQIVMKKFEGKGQRYRKVAKDMKTIRETISVMAKNLCTDESKRNQFTFALDSASDWQQMAELEYLTEAKKDKVYPLVLWAKVYEKMDKVFDTLRRLGFNAVFTQQVKEVYRNEKATGEFAPAGYKKIPYRVDVHLNLRKGIEVDGELYYPEVVVAEVLKDCWHKPEDTKPYLIDVTYEGIFKELKPYNHPKPGDKDTAAKEVLKELEKKTGIPIAKAKAENKEG
jgi:hypothetical protein